MEACVGGSGEGRFELGKLTGNSLGSPVIDGGEQLGSGQ